MRCSPIPALLQLLLVHIHYKAMQLFNLLTLAGASFFAFSGVQGAGNGFSGTCKDIRMKVDSNTVLQASCRKVDGSYTTSTLDLNKCIVNRNGYLQIQAKSVPH